LYDPVLGRFLQADPIIQAPGNAQSHNRYSYVLNNPLSFTDPSGFSAWTKWRRPIVGLVAGILTAGAATWAMSAYAFINGSTFLATAGIQSASLTGVGSAVAAAAGGFAAGGINGGNIQSALRGAFTAALTVGVLQGIESFASGAESVGSTMGASTAADTTSGTYSGTAGATATDAASGAASQLPQVVQRVEITGSSWTSDALDWLAKGPIDRNSVSGAVWMGMMAMPGLSRGASAARAANGGLRSSAAVSAARAEQYMVQEGLGAARAKDFVSSFDGPITARLVRPGETFLRYTDVADSSGSFLTKSVFTTSNEAVQALFLGPYGNSASLAQNVTSVGRSIVFEGAILNGTAQQTLIINRGMFQFGIGVRF